MTSRLRGALTTVLVLYAVLVAAALVAMIAPARAQTPTVSFQSLLEGVSVNTTNSDLVLNRMWIGFLPDAPGEITVSVARGGEVLATYATRHLSADGVFDHYLIHTSPGPVALADGDYQLVFAHDGQPFRRFDFRARIVEGGDRYHPIRIAFLDGPWQAYAGLLVPGPDRPVAWRVLHRNENLVPRQMNGVRRIEVLRDGALFATSEEAGNSKIGVPVTGYHTWTLSEPRLYRVTGPDATEILYGRDLTACGTCAYEVRVDHLDAHLYEDPDMNDGLQKTPTVTRTEHYAFRVADGRVVLEGDQDPEAADPLDLIEGWGTAFWLRERSATAAR